MYRWNLRTIFKIIKNNFRESTQHIFCYLTTKAQNIIFYCMCIQ